MGDDDPKGGAAGKAAMATRRRRGLRLDLRRSPVLAYGLAVAAAALCTLLRLPLQPLIGGSNSFTLYYPAIILVAWFAGLGPALLLTVLSAVAAEAFFIAPYYGTAVPSRDIGFNLALFLVVGAALGRITSGWRRAERLSRVAIERQLAQEQAMQRSEEGARESEERFRIAADGAPVLIWTSGTDRRFDWFNKPWLDFTGRTLEQEVGDGWSGGLPKEDRGDCLQSFALAFDARRAFQLEHRLRRADGAYRWVEERGVPRFMPDGSFAGFIGSCIDVTDRKRDAEDLQRLVGEQRRDREELQVMARIGHILAAELDVQRLAQALTDEAAAALGATFGALYTVADGRREAPPGRPGDLVALAASGVPRETLLAPLPSGAPPFTPPLDGEGLLRSDDLRSDVRWNHGGGEPPLAPLPSGVRSYLAAPVVAGGGQLRGGLVFGHADPGRFGEREERILSGVATQAAVALENAYLFREAHEARDAAEAANRSKDEFLATVSHELRTPLNAMMGWAQLLQMSRDDEAKRTTGLETIVRNAKLQAQLIDDLLDMARIVSGKMRLDVRTVDLVKVIDAAIDAARPAAEAKAIRILRLLDPLVGPVAGDPDRLQQVVWNLLSNAVKFTPRGGKVEVRLERVNSHLEIMVSDTGAGIDPEFLPHVFERFRQSDSSTTRSRGGLGLGLAIVRHLVELHGGTVQVKSPGEGRGSTFIVRLPLSVAHLSGDRVHPRAKDDEATAEGAPDLTGVRVLVVDDEADSRDTLRHVLEHCGATVETAGSAAEALALLPKFHPQVLLSDVGMPEQDGYSFIRQVRKLPAAQGGATPAAALTAFARTEDRRRALLAGFEMHLSKPVEVHELCTVVATLARRLRAGAEDQGVAGAEGQGGGGAG